VEFGEADAFIKRRFAVSQSVAIQALGAVVERLRGEGYRLAGCGLLLSSGLPPSDLRATLRSHALIHAAEGHFFREALLEACRHLLAAARMDPLWRGQLGPKRRRSMAASAGPG